MPVKKLLFFASLLLFLSFILFSYLVAKEQFTQLDFDTMVKLQDHLSRRLDLPFSFLSLLGSAEITGFFWFCLVIFLSIKKMFKVASALILLPLALAIELFGKLFVFHPGPPHLLYRGVIKFDFPSSFVPVDYSYPSGHVTRTAFLIVFLICYIYFRRVKNRLPFSVLLFSFLILMLISRVYLGEHWSSDVVGGLLIGSSFGIFSALLVPAKKT